jgi:hypothetical protein
MVACHRSPRGGHRIYDIRMRTVDLAGPAPAEHRLTAATIQALWAIDPAESPPR